MRTSLTAALCAVVASLALATGAQAKSMSGTAGADRLSGTASADSIKGRAGDDRINPRKGRDRVNAGSGDDTVNARDNSADKVTCGAGHDTVRLDAEDTADSSCEDVRQSGEQTDSQSDPNQRPQPGDGRDCPAKEEQSGSGEPQSDQG